MKKFACILLGLASFLPLRAETAIGEGWYNTSFLSKGTQISDSNFSLTEGMTLGTPQSVGEVGAKRTIMRVAATGGTETNADIVNLANMLDNDPKNIIEYVRDNIVVPPF